MQWPEPFFKYEDTVNESHNVFNLIGKITDPCHLNLILFISFIITEPSNSICDRVPYTYCRTQSMVRRTSPIFSDR